jgi:mRNA-degrading endonuclease RelE of RelBE toxin-antitoxin system
MNQLITIYDIYQELKTIEQNMVTHEDLDALIDTVEIISNPKTMEGIHKSDMDIKEGRVKEISSVDDLISELWNMTWVVMRTDTFLESFKTIKKNKDVLAELDKKLIRLSENPLHVGGWLSGELHGKKSTRIAKRYRLIFTPDEMERVVYLNWIDHREHVY